MKKKQKSAPCENEKMSISTVPAAVENECKIMVSPEDDLPPTPADEKESIIQKFLVEMPEDFYSFWSFCKTLSPDKPEGMLYRGADKSLARPGRKQANVSVRMV